ncbi:MAG: hypothetical protein Q4G23_00330 [Clostridia bacterium]|nr:hypothetical protein [Clostridia bacterium]
MKRKMKFLALLVCAAMILFGISVFATVTDAEDIIIEEEIIETEELPEIAEFSEEAELFAEGAVCYIGDDTENTYTSLNTAIYNANGETIHLLSDATLEAATNLGTSGGYVIDGTGENGENYTITLSGEVAIANEHSGTLTNVNVDMAGYRFDIKGTTEFTLGSGTVIKNGGGGDGGTAIVRSGATLNIEEGCIIRNSTASANGGALHVRGTVNMSGGSIEDCKSANRGGAVALYEDGVMKISGNATITGNISTAKGVNNVEVRDADSLILADDFTGTIGITFDNAESGTLFGIVEDGASGAENFIFDEDSSVVGYAKEGALYLVKDGVCYTDDRITGTVYETLDEAISAVTEKGTVIYLIGDYTYTGTKMPANQNGFVLDGNGHTLKLNSVVEISDINGLEFTDITVDLNKFRFTIKRTGSNKCKVILGDRATLTNGYVASGSYGGAAYIYANTEVVMKEGSSVTNCEVYNGGGAFFVVANATLTMEGGSITGCSAYGRGGGVLVNPGGKIVISGDAEITGNTSTANGDNLEVRDASAITLAGDFTGSIGVTIDNSAKGVCFGTATEGASGAENLYLESDSSITGTNLNGTLFFKGEEDFCCYLASHTDGVTTYLGAYSVLKDALTAANGNTVHLAKDVSFPSGNLGTSGYIIDGEGYTITFTGDVTLLNEAGAVFKNVTVDLNEKHITVTVNNGTTSVLTLGDGAHFKNGKGSNGGAALLNSGVVLNMEPGSMISGCTATGNGGTVHVNGGTFNMKGGTITGGTTANRGGGILVVESGTLNLSGNATVTGNTSSYGARGPVNNIEIRDFDSLNIAGDFSGEVGISYYDNTTFTAAVDSAFGTAATGVTIEKIENIKADKAELYAYIDGNSLKWTSKPSVSIQADSGVYSDKTGVIRFLTTFESVSPAAVSNYGTYALATDEFDIESDASALTKFCSFDVTPGNGKAYIVDIVEIPEDKTETLISGISFVKIKGVATPCYMPYVKCISVASCNGTIKNLGTKPASGI